MGSRCGRSPGGTRWGTPATFASHVGGLQPDAPHRVGLKPDLRSYRRPAAHVWPQDFGHLDRTIRTLVVLHHRDERAPDREPRAVQRVHELGLALRVAKARLHAP